MSPPTIASRLLLLGGADLLRADGTTVDELVRQPKRLALLAYLAAAGHQRLHRRDRLLAMFWPELDQQHARSALRRALYFVRQQIGTEGISSRGDELGVDPSHLWCDVAAFDDAIERGEREAALALYRGDLLEGFFVPSAPDFERWLDDERRRLRLAASRVAAELADGAERRGRFTDAMDYARRALALAPEDEVGVRRLLILYDHAGDRASALQVYGAFAQRLAAELGLEPSPETHALVERIRTRSAPAAPAHGPASPAAPVHPDVIAVMPFTVRLGAEHGYLREGIVDLVSAKLDGAGDLRTVDPQALLAEVRSRGLDTVAPDQARHVAERLGAGAFLLGRVVGIGSRWQVRATLYQTRGPGEVRVDLEAEPEQGVFAVVDQLVRHLLATRTSSTGGHLGRLGAMTTDSLPALKAYLSGERAFRSGRYRLSSEAYERATAGDPEFALAYYRLAAACVATGRVEEAHLASRAALERRRRLAEPQRLLVAAQAALLDGRVDQAEKLYGRVLDARPDDVEAWFHLGHALFRYNLYRGRSATEGRVAFERTRALDRTHAGALEYLVRLAALERRPDDLRRLAERFLEETPSADRALNVRVLLATQHDPSDLDPTILAELATARPAAIATAIRDIARFAQDREAATALLPRIAARAPRVALGGLPQLLLAHLAASAGDPESCRAFLAEAREIDPHSALEHRALLVSVASPDDDQDEVARTRQEIASAPPPVSSPGAAWPPPLHSAIRPHVRLYLAGLLAARVGQLDLAERQAESCRTLPAAPGVGEMPRNLARGLLAEVAWRHGDAAGAVERLQTLETGRWSHYAAASPFFSLARERWLLAAALDRLGRRGESQAWRAGLGERSAFELVFAAKGALASPPNPHPVS